MMRYSVIFSRMGRMFLRRKNMKNGKDTAENMQREQKQEKN